MMNANYRHHNHYDGNNNKNKKLKTFHSSSSSSSSIDSVVAVTAATATSAFSSSCFEQKQQHYQQLQQQQQHYHLQQYHQQQSKQYQCQQQQHYQHPTTLPPLPFAPSAAPVAVSPSASSSWNVLLDTLNQLNNAAVCSYEHYHSIQTDYLQFIHNNSNSNNNNNFRQSAHTELRHASRVLERAIVFLDDAWKVSTLSLSSTYFASFSNNNDDDRVNTLTRALQTATELITTTHATSASSSSPPPLAAVEYDEGFNNFPGLVQWQPQQHLLSLSQQQQLPLQSLLEIAMIVLYNLGQVRLLQKHTNTNSHPPEQRHFEQAEPFFLQARDLAMLAGSGVSKNCSETNNNNLSLLQGETEALFWQAQDLSVPQHHPASSKVSSGSSNSNAPEFCGDNKNTSSSLVFPNIGAGEAGATVAAPHHPFLIPILHRIGYIQYKQEDTTAAISTLETALQVLTTQKDDETNDPQKEHHEQQHQLFLAATLNCLGVLYFLKKTESDPCEALICLLQALELQRKLFGSTLTMNNNTNNNNNHKNDMALQLMVRTCSSKTRHNNNNDSTVILSSCSPSSLNNNHGDDACYLDSVTAAACVCRMLATTLNNIGRVHFTCERYTLALAAYEEAMGLRQTVFGVAFQQPDHIDVAATIYNTGQTLHQTGEFHKALQFYQTFRDMATRHQERWPVRYLVLVLKSMALIYHQLDQPRDAVRYFHEALEAAQDKLGPHPETASIRNKLGNFYYQMGELEKALRMYQQGLKVERQIFPTCHPNVTVTISNIAQIYKQRGELDLALKYYKEALKHQMMKKPGPNTAVTLSNMGLIQYQQGRYKIALELYQEALGIRRDAFGDSHLDVASSLSSIGLVLFKLGVYDFALESFGESLRIRQKLLGPSHRDVAIILYNIATIKLELGDDDSAMQLYGQALAVEKAVLGPDHQEVAQTLQYIAKVHQQRGEIDRSLDLYEQALLIHRNFVNNSNNNKNTEGYSSSSSSSSLSCKNGNNNKIGQASKSIASILSCIADLKLQKGQIDGVMQAMGEACRILQQLAPSSSSAAPAGQERAGSDNSSAAAAAAGEELMNKIKLCSFDFYGFAKFHPEAAAAA